MTDFLTHLAARALGRATHVHPDLGREIAVPAPLGRGDPNPTEFVSDTAALADVFPRRENRGVPLHATRTPTGEVDRIEANDVTLAARLADDLRITSVEPGGTPLVEPVTMTPDLRSAGRTTPALRDTAIEAHPEHEQLVDSLARATTAALAVTQPPERATEMALPLVAQTRSDVSPQATAPGSDREHPERHSQPEVTPRSRFDAPAAAATRSMLVPPQGAVPALDRERNLGQRSSELTPRARSDVPATPRSTLVAQPLESQIPIAPNLARDADMDAGAREPVTVRVTIGRIDVRAAPPRSAPQKSSPPARSGISLDAYLKQRNEGRR